MPSLSNPVYSKGHPIAKRSSVAFFGDDVMLEQAYGDREKEALRELCSIKGPAVNLSNFDQLAGTLEDVETIFCTWSMPRLEAHHLDRLPALRAVFFAAGSVKYFAEPLLERNILLVSAQAANAVPTAEFAFAQILLSMKGAFRNQREYRRFKDIQAAYRGPGNYEESVALLGLGAVGTRVAELLQTLDVKVLAYDPFLSEKRGAMLRVERVTLEEAFARAFVVSNHMPYLPETERIITRELFAAMRPDATFVNTSRGAIVDQAAMITVLQERPDLQALLDVSDPEPPEKDSPLFSLANVYLTSHIAGSVKNEVRRMGQHCIALFEAWQNGQSLEHQVTWEKFACMA